MLYVFEAIKNRFHATNAKELCREIYLVSGEDESKPQRTKPCVTVTNNGSELQPTDSVDIETFDLSFTVFSNKVKADVSGGILEMVQSFKRAFDEQKLPSASFTTGQLVRLSSAQPNLVDGTYQAELRYELTVCWNADPSLLRYA